MKNLFLFSLLVVSVYVDAAPITTPEKPVIEMLEQVPGGKNEKIDLSIANESQYLTGDQDKLLQAKALESFFFENFSSFKANTDAFYKLSSEDEADRKYTADTYGGLTGVRLYHFYDELFALGRMIRLSAVVSPDHTSTYIDMAVEYVDEFVPKLLSGHGTKYCGVSNSRFKCNASPPTHRFLDASRGMAWLGYLMDSVLLADSGYAGQFAKNAQALRPVLDRHVSQCYKTVVLHMSSHVGLAADLLGRLGGYREDYNDELNACINDGFIANIAKTEWVSSDLAHAEMSANYVHYVYEQQQRGNIIPGQQLITLEHMDIVARTFLARFDSGEHWHFTDTLLGNYALLSRGANPILDRLLSPSEYQLVSPTGTHRVTHVFNTVASYAYGLAFD